MKNEYKFSPMIQKDIPLYADLFIQAFSKAPWNDTFSSPQQVIDFIKAYMESSSFIGYVLHFNQQMAAICIGAKKPWINGMEYYIDQFCVSPHLQNRGIGSLFLHMIEDDIKKHGMNAMLLSTELGFPAENFYVKNGFQRLKNTIILVK